MKRSAKGVRLRSFERNRQGISPGNALIFWYLFVTEERRTQKKLDEFVVKHETMQI